MSKEKFVEAKQLIEQLQYDDARAILESLDHPRAREWEAKLIVHEEELAFSEPARPPKPETAVSVVVTTGDVAFPYDVIGPVYYQISNKGVFSSELKRKKNAYEQDLKVMRETDMISKARGADWGFLYGEFSVGQNDFDTAFYIAVRELQQRAHRLKGDAIISMRQDIDLDTNQFQYFYLQMYGTAIRFR